MSFSGHVRYSMCPIKPISFSMTLDPPSPAPTAQAAAPGQRSRKAARVLVPLSIAVAVLITIAWLVALILFARWLIAAAV